MVVSSPLTVAGAAAALPSENRRTAFPWLALAGTTAINVACRSHPRQQVNKRDRGRAHRMTYRKSNSGSEALRPCQRSIDTASDKGVRGNQPALSNSGFCKKCET